MFIVHYQDGKIDVLTLLKNSVKILNHIFHEKLAVESNHVLLDLVLMELYDTTIWCS